MHSSKVHRPGDIRILRKVAQLSRTEDYLSEANFFAMYGFLLTVVSRRCHDLFKYRVFLLQCSIRLSPKACGQPVVWAQLEVTFALSQKASGDPAFRLSPFCCPAHKNESDRSMLSLQSLSFRLQSELVRGKRRRSSRMLSRDNRSHWFCRRASLSYLLRLPEGSAIIIVWKRSTIRSSVS